MRTKSNNAAAPCNAAAVLVALMLVAPSAQAYIDPGTGMLAIQGLIALVIGVIAFIKHPIQTVRGWVERWRHRNDRDA